MAYVICPGCHLRYALRETPDHPRTTGRGSQWNHIVGHSVLIGADQGLSWRESLIETCQRAITKGYPYKTSRFGQVIPLDYKAMTMKDASVVIEQLHEDAVFLGVTLIEEKWEVTV